MRVVIIGGGIGGLAMALMCAERRLDCVVYEQSDSIRELGVGINILPHAIRELVGLGLLPRLDAVAIRTRELIYMNRFGQVVWREPRGIDGGYEVPQFSVHRGRLQGVLYEAVRARIGAGRVLTGHRVAAIEETEGGVDVALVDRDGVQISTDRGDVVVAADGIHSATRRRLFPGEGPPAWNGIMLWRGALELPRFLDGRTMVIAGGMSTKYVVYPIAVGAAPGTQLVNWAVAAKVGDGSSPPPRREDWSRVGRMEDLAPHLAAFRIPGFDPSALPVASGEFWEYPMCDRDPLPRWTHGRVTLLGDAAHPMYPVGSNGASQAILDARCLADLLVTAEHPRQALAAYEAERLPKTAEIVRLNRKGGPEGVIDAVEQLAPDGFTDIDSVLSYEERKAIVQGYATTAGFAREQVNRAAAAAGGG
jgi:2-polyprenyl-6-methoxyphenol hydroxylase-like FAD-dependent oxidoreductase